MSNRTLAGLEGQVMTTAQAAAAIASLGDRPLPATGHTARVRPATSPQDRGETATLTN